MEDRRRNQQRVTVTSSSSLVWRTLRRAAFALLLCSPFAGSDGQVVQPEPGARIRFRTTAGDSLRTGTLAQITVDSLILGSCACARLGYSRREVNHIEVFRRGAPGMRALGGFGLGFLAGAVLGLFSASSCSGSADACDLAELAVPAGAIIGGILGALVGFLGAYSWQPVT